MELDDDLRDCVEWLRSHIDWDVDGDVQIDGTDPNDLTLGEMRGRREARIIARRRPAINADAFHRAYAIKSPLTACRLVARCRIPFFPSL